MVGIRRQIRTLAFILGLLVFTGCAGLMEYNPATGHKELIFLSTKEEVALGAQSHKELMQHMKLAEDPALWAQLNRIGARLAKVSDRQDYPYKFYLIQGKDLNAFTTPGGNIYIYTALMKTLQTDDRIAGVLAHEIGHCAAKHVAKKYQKALGYNLIYNIAMAAVGNGSSKEIVQIGSGPLMNLIFSAYSRKDEYEADKLGVKYATLAGYDPHGLLEALQILLAKEKGPEAPAILSTHPPTKERIAALKTEVALAKYKYLNPKP